MRDASTATLRQLPQNAKAADILAIAFGAAVAMWSAGYFCRLFGPAVPAWLLFGVMLLGLLGGGFVVGRRTKRGIVGGLTVGLIAGLINLLIVGSLIGGTTPNSIRAGALMWIPGCVLVSVLLSGIGAAVGSETRPRDAVAGDWLGALAGVAAFATLVLLGAGGLVTGFDEGLAVVDWPNSEGYNMFLYPLSRMTGGVYLEHAHRLLGSLVGLTTLVLAIHVTLTDKRPGIRRLVWLTFAGVVVQGILGGLRVTGRFTLSTDPNQTAPSIILAVVHGVFGQLVFAGLVTLALLRSAAWRAAPPVVPSRHAGTDRTLGAWLIGIVIVQLVLGALVRHFTWALQNHPSGLAVDPKVLADVGQWALTVHMTFATAVLGLAIAVGIRAWGLYGGVRQIQRLGTWLLAFMGAQLVLGIAAVVVTANDAVNRPATAHDVMITTLHQIIGACILALAILILGWNYRLTRPVAAAEAAAAETTITEVNC